jgi:hypothetical protein
MFESDSVSDAPLTPAIRRPPASRRLLTTAVGLAALGTATLMVCGFVSKVQDAADRNN